MNIIITKELHQYLQTIIVESIIFGSVARENVRDEHSDIDYMHIVKCHKSLLTSSVYSMHSLQYKEVDETGKVIADHVYSTIPQFIQGIINSESMIPWECLFDGVFQENSVIQPLMEYTELMTSFKAARGFLGLAKRDLKDASKYFNHDKHKCAKKLDFAVRSLEYCEWIIQMIIGANNQFYEEEKRYDWVDWQTDYQKFSINLNRLNTKVELFRTYITNMLNENKILYSCSIETLQKLHTHFLNDVVTLTDNKFSLEMMDLYYKAAIENKFN